MNAGADDQGRVLTDAEPVRARFLEVTGKADACRDAATG